LEEEKIKEGINFKLIQQKTKENSFTG